MLMDAVSADRRVEDDRRVAFSEDDDGGEGQEGAHAPVPSRTAGGSASSLRSPPVRFVCASCGARQPLSPAASSSPDAPPDPDLSPADAPLTFMPFQFEELPLSNALRGIYHDRGYWSNGREWTSLLPSVMLKKLSQLRARAEMPLMSWELLEFWDAVDKTSGWDAMRRADQLEKEALAVAKTMERTQGVGLSDSAGMQMINLRQRNKDRIRDLLALDQAWLAYRAFEEENGIETEDRIRARLARFPPAALPSLTERNEAERQASLSSHSL
ncbi:hypothetical protein JCM10213_000047 [Rhodosporidiobolus nylandii]